MDSHIDLIVGLGNPEPQYLMTRHNLGFWFVDLLAREYGASFRREKKLNGESTEIVVAGHRLRLLKPLTFMNLSGRSVAAAAAFYKTPAERILVAYDELDLPPGSAKLKFGGGDAGHNGMKSVIEGIGREFWRLRLGIGHPGPGRRDEVVGYVLRRPSPEDEELMLEAVGFAIETLPVLVELGGERAKNQLHGRKPRPRDEDDGAGAPS
jgi:peptidyl-tRNA hydrolase, PTH1 family